MPQIGRESITVVIVLIGSSIGPAIAAIYMQTYQQELANRVSGGGGGGGSSSFPSPISYDLIFLTAALISAISTDQFLLIKRNWRDVHPTIAYQIGIDRRLLSAVNKAREDIQGSSLDPQYRCLKAITYVSFAELQPRLSHEPLVHNNQEEVYYIINGTGKIKIGNEEARLRDGDIIYIPENTTHSIINDGEEMLAIHMITTIQLSHTMVITVAFLTYFWLDTLGYHLSISLFQVQLQAPFSFLLLLW